MDILITIPKSTKWSDYEKELEIVKDGKMVMNFKVSNFPKKTFKGEKCYLAYDGFIIGYMNICGFARMNFICNTTGVHWKGNFIQRTGKFHKLKIPVPCKGFQGFRYVTHDFKKENNLEVVL